MIRQRGDLSGMEWGARSRYSCLLWRGNQKQQQQQQSYSYLRECSNVSGLYVQQQQRVVRVAVLRVSQNEGILSSAEYY